MTRLADRAPRRRCRGRLVRVVARRALERPRGAARREKAGALPQTVRMRHDVDAARLLEERPLIVERLRRQVAEFILPFPQHRDGRVHMTLLADVEASSEWESRGIH